MDELEPPYESEYDRACEEIAQDLFESDYKSLAMSQKIKVRGFAQIRSNR